ncbi:hypothetical protein VTK56DRAFT_8854 [Thermocarpiscus australiensis]
MQMGTDQLPTTTDTCSTPRTSSSFLLPHLELAKTRALASPTWLGRLPLSFKRSFSHPAAPSSPSSSSQPSFSFSFYNHDVQARDRRRRHGRRRFFPGPNGKSLLHPHLVVGIGVRFPQERQTTWDVISIFLHPLHSSADRLSLRDGSPFCPDFIAGRSAQTSSQGLCNGSR